MSRPFRVRRAPAGARALALLALGAAGAAFAQGSADELVAGVERVVIPVADLDRSVGFFCGVLEFEPIERRDWRVVVADRQPTGARARAVVLRLGDELVELAEFDPPGRPMPPDTRSNDHWFQHVAIIVRDMDVAFARLEDHGVERASPAPQTLPAWNTAAGGIRAYYFRDPDGHFLELLQFPPGKGDAKWHVAGDRLFLGIDHTAIVVADTARSVAYYRGQFGLRVAGESTNYGPEQERLNNVAGARLRITSLRGAAGPGIELLEYLAPGGGRPAPPDPRAGDLWRWETCLTGRPSIAGGGEWRTSDPDGHALVVAADAELQAAASGP